MGLTRKLMSASTLGLVDFRSDKERTAAYTKAQRDEMRKQTKLARGQATQGQAWPPPGWGPAPSTAVPPGEPLVADELTKLAQLRDGGVLTAAEFEAQKAKLLG